MIPVICLTAVAAIISVTAILKRDIFTPINVFLITQLSTLGVAYLQLDPAMTDFHAFTWITYGGATISFVIGASLHSFFWHTQPPTQPPSQEINWKLYHLLSWVVFIAFWLCCIPAIRACGTLPLFFSGHLSALFGPTGTAYTNQLVYGFASGPLTVLLFTVSSYKSVCKNIWVRRSSQWMRFVALFSIVLLNPTRASLIAALAFILFSHHCLYQKISAWALPILAAFVVSLFFGIGYMKSQYNKADVDLPMKRILHLPYTYVANNYWNTDYALNPPNDREIHPFTWGLDALNGFSELPGLGAKFRNAFHWDNPYNYRIQKVEGLNTTGYLWQTYKDFREFGAVGTPLLAGFLLGWLYRAIKNRFNLLYDSLYILFIYLLSWWWFNDSYKSGLYWIWVAIIYLVSKACVLHPMKFRAPQVNQQPITI